MGAQKFAIPTLQDVQRRFARSALSFIAVAVEKQIKLLACAAELAGLYRWAMMELFVCSVTRSVPNSKD